MEILCSEIKIGKRHRKEMGDLDALAKSIEEVGLLQPIGVTTENVLIFGKRRLEAVHKILKRNAIEALVLRIGSIVDGEYAENEIREDFRPSERVAIARTIQAEIGSRQGQRTDRLPDNCPEVAGCETREVAAERAGFSSSQEFRRASKVVDKGIPELVVAVDSGEIAVSDAAYAAGKTHPQQRVILKRVQAGTARNVSDAIRKISLAKQIELVNKTPPPKGKFNVIAVDPPWRYEKTREDDPTQRGRTPYPTMTVDEICDLRIPADTDCVLWLWTTNAHLADGSVAKVLKAWGFTGKTILTWAKNKMGLGDWLRGKTEHCVVAAKGKPVHATPGSNTTLLEAPVGEHSEKPEAFFELVGRLCPGRRLEMFARKKSREGWTLHGSGKGEIS